MRIVFDTNTIISAILVKNSVPAKAFDLACRSGIMLASGQTIKELTVVIFRSKFDKYVSIESRRNFLIAYLNSVEFIKIKSSISLSKDISDNKFLDLAIDGNADYLVTGDRDLLEINTINKLKILKSVDFINILFTNL